MNYRLKSKNVIAITWDKEHSQEVAISNLKEIGCTDIKVKTSGAGNSIDFKYPTPNSIKENYYGSLFYGLWIVFDEDGKIPIMCSNTDFNNLYEKK